jgi:hypothetical protein
MLMPRGWSVTRSAISLLSMWRRKGHLFYLSELDTGAACRLLFLAATLFDDDEAEDDDNGDADGWLAAAVLAAGDMMVMEVVRCLKQEGTLPDTAGYGVFMVTR